MAFNIPEIARHPMFVGVTSCADGSRPLCTYKGSITMPMSTFYQSQTDLLKQLAFWHHARVQRLELNPLDAATTFDRHLAQVTKHASFM